MSEQQVLRICTDVMGFVEFFTIEGLWKLVDNRANRRRKGKKRRSRFKIGEHEDFEIQAEINKGNIVSIMQDY